MENKKYTEFNNQLQIMHDYIYSTPEKQIELGINAEQLQQFGTYKTKYNQSFNTYLNPETKTQAAIQQIKDDYTLVHKWIAELRQIIKHSKADTLTDQDYASMFIHKDKTPSKHTKPDTTPVIELDHIEHLNARISAKHAAAQEKGTRPSLPLGVDIIDWQWVVNDEREAIDTLIYSEHKTSQSATLKLSFDPSQTGQFCHIIARYGITSGALGAFSVSLSFAIT